MKPHIFKLAFPLLFIVANPGWAEAPDSAAMMEENRRIANDKIEFRVELDFESADMLKKKLVEIFSEMKKKNSIPEFLNPDIENKNKSLSQFSLQSQIWVNEQLIDQVVTPEIINLSKKFPFLGYNDFSGLVFDSFLSFMRGEEWDIVEQMRSKKLYWDEIRTPEQVLSPLDLNKIIWIYKLPVERRERGILHVGLDSVTHNFICYEYTIGIYYPEGKTMERIFSEIVQDPSRFKSAKKYMKNPDENPQTKPGK